MGLVVRWGMVLEEGLTGDDVLFPAQEVADGFLVDVAVLFLEVVREAECYDWQTRVVIGAGFVVFAEDDFAFALVDVLSLFAMDV